LFFPVSQSIELLLMDRFLSYFRILGRGSKNPFSSKIFEACKLCKEENEEEDQAVCQICLGSDLPDRLLGDPSTSSSHHDHEHFSWCLLISEVLFGICSCFFFLRTMVRERDGLKKPRERQRDGISDSSALFLRFAWLHLLAD